MRSIWTRDMQMPRFAPLRGNQKTDVAIIGGGLAGLLCAYFLDRAGVDYLLVEAKNILGGITQNTTAKITSQHGLIYDKLIKRMGVQKARLYLQANEAALAAYRKLCRKIDCDFTERDNFVYSRDDHKAIERELSALKKLGAEAKEETDLPLPFAVSGAVKFGRQAQFHPLKFGAGIARDLRIYEHTKALELMPGKVITTGGIIRADRIIMATHFPILNKHGGFPFKMYQDRSYVLGLQNAPDVGGMYIDADEKGLSFRNFEGLLLLGGGSHRTGKKGGGWKELETFARRNFPRAQIVARWATQDCMTLDGAPYIGPYSKRTPDLFVTTGFNKWGMTASMVGAQLLTDLMLGRKNPYAPVFDPSRALYLPQLALNMGETAINFITPTVPRCPHLGCALKYNPQEHTWDCPCHGSRFGTDGRLIDNPATDDKRM